MALPAQREMLATQTQEADYGSDCLGRDSLLLRAPLTTRHQHPVEATERKHRAQQQELDLGMATRSFGAGFAMHLRHERAAAKMPLTGHLTAGVDSTNVMLDSLTGRDLDLDFGDTLAQDLFSNLSPHEIMERKMANKF